jgi:hypothetical protein
MWNLSLDIFKVAPMPIRCTAECLACFKSKAAMSPKTARLVQWNVEIISKILRQIEAQRELSSDCPDGTTTFGSGNGTVINEVQEVIALPNFNGKPTRDSKSVKLDKKVGHQLHNLVSTVATLYRDNPFHNFEHTSLVTMEVIKLITQILS